MEQLGVLCVFLVFLGSYVVNALVYVLFILRPYI